MGKTTELKMVINMAEGTKATHVKLAEGGKSIEITYSVFDAIPNLGVPEDDFEQKFPIVEASKLSLEDDFLKHEPKTHFQRMLKESLIAGLKSGLKDFRRPVMDPSFKDDKIVYEAGLMPATGKSCIWWRENAKKFMPERNSRLGNVTEYAAFLGVLIKYLINEMGYTVSQAWEAVCNDSKELGHYRNSENAKNSFESTGSRMIGRLYDLANTSKILSIDNLFDSLRVGASHFEFLRAGGSYDVYSKNFPFAGLYVIIEIDTSNFYSVGWLVLDA